MLLNIVGGSPIFCQALKRSIGRVFQPTAAISYTAAALSKQTSLFDYHVNSGGKMVDFAGWVMPVVYSDQTIKASHLHTRQHCSIFDVSHMLQTKLYGKDRVKFIEALVVSDIHGLADNTGTLTVFTNEDGGILDDLIVNKTSNGYLYVVSNAGCRENDLQLLQNHLARCKSQGMDIELEILSNPLLAVQGPHSPQVLQEGTDVDLSQLYFMNTVEADLFGISDCRITRCGYTGEDGFEISIPEGSEAHILDCLQNFGRGRVKLAGLGARDSLRLEAGLCLYGHDISVDTTPVEATLAWLIGKRRRQDADFPGAERILSQLKNKPDRKRVGLITKSGPPPREGSVIEVDGKEVGQITSGCPSPSLNLNIAMAYIDTKLSKVGTPLQVVVRNRRYDGHITKMPFIASNYYMKK